MKKEIKIGILAVAVLAASFVLVNYLKGKDLFGREVEFIGYFDNVETLVASAPVQIRGYAAGRVNSVEYDSEKDAFKVVCAVKKEFKVPADSRLMLYSTSIMGGKAIKIELGCSEQLAKDSDVLQTGSEADLLGTLAVGLGPMMAKVSQVLDSVSVIAGNVNSILSEENKRAIAQSLDNLNRTLSDARHLAATLDGKSSAVNAIVDNLADLSAKLSPIVESAGTTIENLNNVSGQLASSDIAGTVENLRKALASVDSTVTEVSQPLDSLISNADKLIKNISENPKKYIKITIF